MKTSVRRVLDATPDQVWQIVGPFEGMAAWHPWVAACNMSADGKVRTIPTPAGDAVERLLEESEAPERWHRYTVESGPMPLADYEATLGVREIDGGAELYYESICTADDVPEDQLRAQLEGFFNKGFDAVEKMLAEG